MGLLRYAINISLDGCCDHEAGVPDQELHRYWEEKVAEAGALLYGRTAYEMMESAWREPAETGVKADWMDDWMMSFARTIHAARKYVVSSKLERVDWNSELVRGDLYEAVQRLKRETTGDVLTGGIRLPLALAELGLIDEYEIVIHPAIAGRGPTLLAGLSKPAALRLVSQRPFDSGAVAMRYELRT
ncbi:MAG TPA: dihydrofolate reductase family protein [Caulifigura sp.]|jgi:dihydrofolate reductase|nr:dihydrofolate reductase family protein [Caulifigura sp.]